MMVNSKVFLINTALLSLFSFLILHCSTFQGRHLHGKCIKGDCEDGYGTFAFYDGNVYTGNFKKGLMHEHGRINYYDGNVYTGQFFMGFRNKNGNLVKHHGYTFQEKWNKGELKSREVVQKYRCVKGNCYNGLGVLLDQYGDKYTGNFKNGVYHGEGTYSGTTHHFKGFWRNGIRDTGLTIEKNGTKVIQEYGKSSNFKDYTIKKPNKYTQMLKCLDIECSVYEETIIFQNKIKYVKECTGKLCANVRKRRFFEPSGKELKGVFFEKGICIEGDCKNAKHNEILFENGQRFIGNIKNGLPIGQNKLIYPNNTEYKGELKKQGYFYRVGKGEYVATDSSKYIGNWLADKKHGYGIEYDKKGNIINKGKWEYGKLKASKNKSIMRSIK